MKIAVLSPIAWRTPPEKYGPWEQVASNMAEGLVDRGHEVTLFATGNSLTKGKLQHVTKEGYGENSQINPKVWECLHISSVMEQAGEFDVIHNHFDFLPLTYSKLVRTPMVTTIHGFSSPSILPVYQKYNGTKSYVSISEANRIPELTYRATVYNGLNTDEFTFQDCPEDYLLFFGRIHPEKGTYEAIQIAKAAGRRLLISGLIQDQEYFDQKVLPFVNDDDITYLGNSGPQARNTLLGGAAALLHPISFEEPFGLSVAEAMLCGTPVIAFRRGSMAELIVDGTTGFLVSSIGQAVEALSALGSIDRHQCRRWAESKFSKETMTEAYIQVYRSILQVS